MFPQAQIKHNIGNTIEFQNQIDARALTYFSTSVVAGVTSLPAINASDFTAGNILLLVSSLANENAEIVTSSAHTTTGFTVAATIQEHFRGDSIQQINYDQVVVQKSSTIDGVYSVLSTSTIQVTQGNTIIYDPIGLTTDYYKLQWRNSITGAVSELSDPFSVSSYDPSSAGALATAIKLAMGIKANDQKISDDFMLSSLQDARNIVKTQLFGIRMPWLQEFEYPIKCLAGNNFVELPDNIDFNTTDRSLLSARFVVNNLFAPYNLRYIDKRNWNNVAFNLMGTTTAAPVTIGATSIQLENTGDLQDEGSLFVATDDFNQTIMQIEYTSLNQLTNTISGVTGVTRNIPTGTQVWMQPNMSQPMYYTVFDGRIYFDRILPDIMQANNLYIDFYKEMDQITSLYDLIPENYREMYKFYLRYAVKYRRDNDTALDDPDYKAFQSLIQSVFNNLYTGQEQRIITS